MKISVDAECLEELEKKAKRHDFFEGYIKGIEVAFAFAEELVKDIGNRKTEPTISKMEQVDKDINVRSKDEPQTNADQHVQHVESVEPMQTERSE